ncbi:MAG TPA: GAF domain-containing protein [Cytophagales bacterium]|nr:GAF domain-containing protein [Cytophagales bacterium]
MKIINLIKKRALVFSAVLVLVLVTANTLITYYNDTVLEEMTQIKLETERAKHQTSQIWNQVVRNMDIGVRGFALTKSEGLLGPFKDGLRDYPLIMGELEEILKKQGFEDPYAIDSIHYAVDNFVESCSTMVKLIEMDSMADFTAALNADPGKDAWDVFSKSSNKISAFEDKLNKAAVDEYQEATERTMIVQTILFIVGFPTLLFMIFRIIKDQKARLNLFLKLEENNREYIFNPGTPLQIANENEVIDNSIKNFKKATDFISQISAGNFQIDWEEINNENKDLNQQNLAGELMNMRDKMKNIKEEDEKRKWFNEGLAKFSDVIREHQHNLQSLTFEVLVFITKYMKAQQGGLFLLREDEEKNTYLELTSCYAFNRKKYTKKRIELGEGLVGQTFLEGKTIMYTEVPDGYTQITSGLGEATPNCLLIVPMKYNEQVEAVIEIAGFEKYDKYQVEFLERLGEITASTLGAVKNTEKVQILLDQFKEQTELLKAQEEELRQNMEEMEATQEALKREEKEKM